MWIVFQRAAACMAIALAALASPTFGQRGMAGMTAAPKADGAIDPSRWALLIGVGQYVAHPAIGNLKYTVSDVQGLYDVLTGPGGFPKQNVFVMSDQADDAKRPPTYSNIIAQLAATLQLPKQGDIVLVYFAGHGIEEKSTSYLLPSDARMANLRLTGLQLNYVKEQLDACAAEKKILILDACHSGAARNAARLGRTFATDVERMDKSKGMVTISSCDLDQQSFEWDEKGHGVFTYFLMEGLRGPADRDRDGEIVVSELNRYVYDATTRWAAKRGFVQTPKFVTSVMGDIVLRCGKFDALPTPHEPGPVHGSRLGQYGAALALILLGAGGVLVARRRLRPRTAAAAKRVDAAKLVIPLPAGPSRKVFLFAKPKITFGREDITKGPNDIALRLLPVGGPEAENFQKTRTIGRTCGLLDCRPEGVYLRTLSDTPMAVDGEPMAAKELKLPLDCRVSLGDVVELRITTYFRNVLLTAVRISRLGNAENHEYVVIREPATIGPGPGNAITLPCAAEPAAELSWGDGSFELRPAQGADLRVADAKKSSRCVQLAAGQVLELDGQTIEFHDIRPEDFKAI